MDKLVVKDIDINYKRIDDIDYISLTDIAKYKNPVNPANVINK